MRTVRGERRVGGQHFSWVARKAPRRGTSARRNAEVLWGPLRAEGRAGAQLGKSGSAGLQGRE